MIPDRLTIQWHLTDVCNYRCKHCYQESYQDKGANLGKLITSLNKIEKFVDQLSTPQKKVKTHFNFTGGEPFLKDNFLDLLREVDSKRKFSFAILSNGFLLQNKELQLLKELKPRFVQISIEGNEYINDSIRGKGAYQTAIKAIKTYKKFKIPVFISFTANAINYKYFPEVVKTGRKLNVDKVWTDRYLPFGKNDNLLMNTNQVKEFFALILQERKNKIFHPFSKTEISAGRALQFLMNGGQPYSCSAGATLLAIMPNGNILPCRRLPIKVGNLYDDDLMDVYQNNQFLKSLRSNESLDKNCIKCFYKNACKGGLKCLSFATAGDYNLKDPNCWI